MCHLIEIHNTGGKVVWEKLCPNELDIITILKEK